VEDSGTTFIVNPTKRIGFAIMDGAVVVEEAIAVEGAIAVAITDTWAFIIKSPLTLFNGEFIVNGLLFRIHRHLVGGTEGEV
jgi:hypothetical protein